MLPMPARAATITARLEQLGIRRVSFRKPIPESSCLEKSQGTSHLFVSELVPTRPLVELGQQLEPLGVGHTFTESLGQVDGLLDGANAIVVPAGSQLELAEAYEHVALGALGAGLVQMCQGGSKCLLGADHLALSHEQEAKLVFAASKQGGVVFEGVEGARLVRVFDRSAEFAALLVSDAQPVVCPAQTGQVAHRPGGLEGFLIKADGTVVGVVLNVNGGDMLEDPGLGAWDSRIGRPAQLEGSLRGGECAVVTTATNPSIIKGRRTARLIIKRCLPRLAVTSSSRVTAIADHASTLPGVLRRTSTGLVWPARSSRLPQSRLSEVRRPPE